MFEESRAILCYGFDQPKFNGCIDFNFNTWFFNTWLLHTNSFDNWDNSNRVDVDEYPVTIVRYNSREDPRFIIARPRSITMVAKECPEAIKNLSTEVEDREAIRSWCKEYKIEFQEPRWWLCCCTYN